MSSRLTYLKLRNTMRMEVLIARNSLFLSWIETPNDSH